MTTSQLYRITKYTQAEEESDYGPTREYGTQFYAREKPSLFFLKLNGVESYAFSTIDTILIEGVLMQRIRKGKYEELGNIRIAETFQEYVDRDGIDVFCKHYFDWYPQKIHARIFQENYAETLAKGE